MLFRQRTLCSLSGQIPANAEAPAFLEMAKEGELNKLANAAETTLLHLCRPQLHNVEGWSAYSSVWAIFTASQNLGMGLAVVRHKRAELDWLRLALRQALKVAPERNQDRTRQMLQEAAPFTRDPKWTFERRASFYAHCGPKGFICTLDYPLVRLPKLAGTYDFSTSAVATAIFRLASERKHR